jgi:HK97 family phage major capsid protein
MASIDATLTGLHTDARGELRDLDDAEQARWDRLSRVRDHAGARIREHEYARAVYNRNPGAAARWGDSEPAERHGWVTAPGADPALAEFRTAAMRTLDRCRASDALSAAAADRADAVLRERDPQALTARYLAAVGNEAYNSAFGKMLTDPQMGHLRFSGAEAEAVREASYALAAAESRTTMTTGTAGFPLPLTVDSTVIQSGSGATNPLRDLASVTTVGTHDWVGVSSDGVTAAYVAEGVEATDVTPTLAAPLIHTQQGRAFVSFTIESGQDWPGLQAELARLVNDARDVCDATAFLSGNGTNAPFGVLGGDATYSLTTTQRIVTTTTSTYGAPDPWLLKQGIPARFMGNATFAASPAAWDTSWQFVAAGSTTQARQFDAGRGGDFLGRPKVEWSTMAASTTGAPTGAKIMIGGDFRTAYKVVDRLGMTAELIPHMLGSNRLPLGTRGLYCYWRTGAAVVARNALRYLESK